MRLARRRYRRGSEWSLQDVLLRHVDHSEPKATETLQAQEKLLSLPLNYLEESEVGDLLIMRDNQR